MVYQLLNSNNLCDYYNLNARPGINRKIPVRQDKFSFLDDEKISSKLIHFKDGYETHVLLYLPQIHCSSCLYLLENLHKLDRGILSCKVDFPKKEVNIVFDGRKISLRGVAELLTGIGYEPYISLRDMQQVKPKIERSLIYQLGVAGFCFANIMLLSFPEYLGLEAAERNLRMVFRSLNFILALPVLFFSAQPFFISAWKSLRHKFLNIDAPIALAILITFGRSAYEVLSGTGAGYFDSLSGIVFLMLAGRVLQEKTYRQLSFERDYSSYFPVAVTLLKNGKQIPAVLSEIKPGDTLIIHNEELIPADGILTRGRGLVDYSFVTGESLPVLREIGEMVYAGGKQIGNNIEILVIKEVVQSYLTKLWNRDNKEQEAKEKNVSFVHLLSRYFTYAVLLIAFLSAAYWWFHDHARIWNAVTAVMIVACPCALLLSSSFTNGNILRILGRNHFYLRNAQVIENIASVDHVVFDKTGTLTSARQQDISYAGKTLGKKQYEAVGALAGQSNHPLSKALAAYIGSSPFMHVEAYHEMPGKGITGSVDGNQVAIGSGAFISGNAGFQQDATRLYIAWNNEMIGSFIFHNHYRKDVNVLARWMQNRYRISVLSGDTSAESANLGKLFGRKAILRFQQKPQDKLEYIKNLQHYGDKVAMIGDGLNDAVALRQSDVGIAVTDDCNNFTPASDAILEADKITRLPAFIKLCKANRKIILASFILSMAYNIAGLFFAVQGTLSPLVAAILMPSSSLSILLITFGCSNLLARWLKL